MTTSVAPSQPDASSAPTELTSIIIVNTLGHALHHYTETLSDILDADDVLTIDEPSATGQSRLGWIASYLKILMRARKRALIRRHRGERVRVMVTWPVLGYLDVAITRLFLRGIDHAVVMHDPSPLVRAVGYSPVAKRVAAWLLGRRSHLIAHSSTARDLIDADGFSQFTVTLPLPAREPAVNLRRPEAAQPIIRVLGQYKKDRDTALMADLAVTSGVRCEFAVHGRGWPEVWGWEREDAFVSEERMDELITASSAVLVPYRRFYQSAVAVRALEAGTPVIGVLETSLADLYEPGSPLLVSANAPIDDWMRAIEVASAMDAQTVYAIASRMKARCDARWSEWVHAKRTPYTALYARSRTRSVADSKV